MKKANDYLAGYTGTETWHRYMCGVLLTDGVVALAEKFKCWWFIDVIASYQPGLRKSNPDEYQYWKLTKEADYDCAMVICYNNGFSETDNKILVSKQISFTDFDANLAIVFVKNDILLLPSED